MKLINKFKDIKLITTKEQKDNNAKFCYDIAKIIFALVVIGQIAKPEEFYLSKLIVGFIISVCKKTI